MVGLCAQTTGIEQARMARATAVIERPDLQYYRHPDRQSAHRALPAITTITRMALTSAMHGHSLYRRRVKHNMNMRGATFSVVKTSRMAAAQGRHDAV